MADLTITAASVLATGAGAVAHCTAGATITAGQVVYLESATNTVKLADANSGTAEARSPYGIALNGGASGQPIAVARPGSSITIGAALTAGDRYYLSATAGGIAPHADVTTGWYPTVLGIATSTTVLKFDPIESGVAV